MSGKKEQGNTRKMLFVEDRKKVRSETKTALQKMGWDVDTETNGEDALKRIRGTLYDVIILDLRMPKMDGEEVLEHIQDEGLTVPPIIVLSAYATDEAVVEKCKYLGVVDVLKKPKGPSHLHASALAAVDGAPSAISGVNFCESLLDYMVGRRRTSLADLLLASGLEDSGFSGIAEPVLVVGRRWNSWYPSVFPVPGGAYAIVGPQQSGVADSTRRPTAVIDPGFKCLEVFRSIGIPWADIESCVITHNHPDHMGGVLELMAARHALGKQTRAMCNPSSRKMLGDCAGFGLEISKLNSGVVDVFPPYQTEQGWCRVKVGGIETAHEEMGGENSSMGLCVAFERGQNANELAQRTELVLLGDTEYDQARHKTEWMPKICASNVKVVVLHIGSSQFKQRTGKHLYLPGLHDILHDIEGGLGEFAHQGRLLVLISEWGLEHATRRQIEKVFGDGLPGFNKFSPILETIRWLQKGLKRVLLMPADIGLTVGTESGKVYLGSEPVSPEDVIFQDNEDGIEYDRR